MFQVVSVLIQIIVLLLLNISTVCICLIALLLYMRHVTRIAKSRQTSTHQSIFAFFHPYCNGGGGGERVLWQAINAIHSAYPRILCAVYTCDTITQNEILNNVRKKFNIELNSNNIKLIHLKFKKCIEAERYPRFTMLGQSLGSVVLAYEAMTKLVPDVFFDTMGFAFTLPYVKYIAQVKVGCYVHYPTVSTDMLNKVRERRDDFNNTSAIKKSKILTYCKILYYRVFAFIYGWAGARSDLVFVNSTWTKNHIDQIWGIRRVQSQLLYPPCSTEEFTNLQINRLDTQSGRDNGAFSDNGVFSICSLGQFRPEKNHAAQINAFNLFLNKFSFQEEKSKFQLHLIGSCRDKDDSQRVTELKSLSRALQIDQHIHFHIDIPFLEVVHQLQNSHVGIHTMENEHFGISLVEMMSAGCIMLAHDSGGPKLDIICDWNDQKTGYLANNVTGFADYLYEIYSMSSEDRHKLALNARDCVNYKFSVARFENEFIQKINVLVNDK